MTPSELRTEAWLLRGISSIAGRLQLRSETLSFTAYGPGSAWPRQIQKLGALLGHTKLSAELNAGNSIKLFAWQVTEISVSRPWYYFGGGIKLRHQGVSLRISFGQPVGARNSPGRAFADLREVAAMRGRGRLWASALGISSGKTPH